MKITVTQMEVERLIRNHYNLPMGVEVEIEGVEPEATRLDNLIGMGIDSEGARKIPVIKYLRRRVHLGIREAKDLVDGYFTRNNIQKEAY